MGNAISPKFDQVRDKDIELYEQDDEVWVSANSGGISTFAVLGRGKNWWRLDQGTTIPTELRLINDYGNHWLWEPSYSMSLQVYKNVLQQVGEQFYKIS